MNFANSSVLKRLWVRYLFAVGVILCTVAASFFVSGMIASLGERDGSLINESGRQRMLSQRILFYAAEFQAEAKASDRTELERALKTFGETHTMLSTEASEVDGLSALYFQGSPSLDTNVREFLQNAYKVLNQDSGARAALFNVETLAPRRLLTQLDNAADGWEQHARQRAAQLQVWEKIALWLVILVVILTTLIVIVPAFRIVREQMVDQERLRNKLKDRNDRLNQFASVSADLVWETDVDGIIVSAKGRFVDIGVVSIDELLGRSYTETVSMKPDMQKRLTRALETAGSYRGIVADFTNQYGAHRCLLLNGAPRKASDGTIIGYFGAAQDITARENLDRKYRLLVDHMTDLIVTFREDRTIEYASPSVRRYGIDPEDIVGRKTMNFIHPDDVSILADLNKDLFSGSAPDHTQVREFRAYDGDGNIIWLEGRPTVVYDESGKLDFVVSAYRDITVRKLREAELVEARQEAEAAAHAKADFLSKMSHEIRTPLNGVIGFSQVLGQMELSPEQAECVEQVQTASRTLLALINDILDYSKIEAGMLSLEHRPVDVVSIAEETISLVSMTRPDSDVELSVDAGAFEHLWMLGDEVRLRQILTNLVGNSAKFTTEGCVLVTFEQEGDRVYLTVKDTGIGIAKADIARIFEGFQQSDNTISRRFGGTGLGLSITRALVSMMGGTIDVDSEVGVGTEVRISLPFTPAHPEEAAPEVTATPAQRGSGQHIMVVDDVEPNRALAKMILQKAGYEVTTFASAHAAIKALARREAFDVILMDVQMPELDGISATRYIQSMPSPVRDIPILAMTANTTQDQITACLNAGMKAHIAKPIVLDTLLKELSVALPHKDDIDDDEHSECDPTALSQNMEDEAYKALLDACDAMIRTSLEELRALIGGAEGARDERYRSIAELAHRVAGTAGSFGYDTISKAAFDLETVVKKALECNGFDDAVEAAVHEYAIAAEKAAA